MDEGLWVRIASRLRDFPDFPKKGILFKDIMPIFKDPQMVKDMCESVAQFIKQNYPGVQIIAGLEARGFLFGPQVAMNLGIPFIPIRKLGKLPGEKVSATYIKEYGEDTVEIQKDAFAANSKVVIVDDLLATGGTMRAAIDVITKGGGEVRLAICLIELKELKGRDKLNNTKVHCFINI